MCDIIIAPSSRIAKGITIINNLDMSKFPLLLSRILKSVHQKEKRSFSEAEETKLQSSLNLNIADVRLLLETLEFIFEQAAYNLAKPYVLSQRLLQLGMNEDKTATVIQAWTNTAKSVVEKLAQHTVAPEELEDVNWRLHLEMGHSRKSKLGQPLAVFQFAVRNNGTDVKENFITEFTHDELYTFYNQLEAIQGQLDALR